YIKVIDCKDSSLNRFFQNPAALSAISLHPFRGLFPACQFHELNTNRGLWGGSSYLAAPPGTFVL
ncbi:MAG: hypothetical protein ACLTNY_01090, partial [Blautia massiliensis (ex Durand et al. 2017)]